MTNTLLDDAFAHQTWAMLWLIETCQSLSRRQLETSVPGTFGSIGDASATPGPLTMHG